MQMNYEKPVLCYNEKSPLKNEGKLEAYKRVSRHYFHKILQAH